MKTPRITDFDPDAKVPPLKSPLEGMPPIKKPQQKSTSTAPAPLPEQPITHEVPETPAPKAVQKVKTQELGKEGSRELGKQGTQERGNAGKREVGKLFDINETPYRKDSFLFTDKEFEAHEDLKLELRRKFGFSTATKQDIARCALQHIIEDYYQHKENSIVVRILKTRTPR
jgi:hypothetical protein